MRPARPSEDVEDLRKVIGENIYVDAKKRRVSAQEIVTILTEEAYSEAGLLRGRLRASGDG